MVRVTGLETSILVEIAPDSPRGVTLILPVDDFREVPSHG